MPEAEAAHTAEETTGAKIRIAPILAGNGLMGFPPVESLKGPCARPARGVKIMGRSWHYGKIRAISVIAPLDHVGLAYSSINLP